MKKLALLVLPLLAATAPAQSPVTAIASTEVAPGIHLLAGADGFAGGNMTLLSGDARHERIVLIDNGLGAVAELVYAKAREIAGRDIDVVINTHVHGDHLGSNAHFAGKGAVIFAHNNIRQRLLDNPDGAGGPEGLPEVTFSDEVSFHVNGHEALVFHLEAAHTDGDAAILFRNANVLVTGDLQFHGLFPFIDLDNGGDLDGYIAAQERLLAIIDGETRIVPGHGSVNDKAGLAADIDMLKRARSLVADLIAQGMSEAELLAANPLAEFHEDYSWAFITTARMTRTVYRSLTRNQGS